MEGRLCVTVFTFARFTFWTVMSSILQSDWRHEIRSIKYMHLLKKRNWHFCVRASVCMFDRERDSGREWQEVASITIMNLFHFLIWIKMLQCRSCSMTKYIFVLCDVLSCTGWMVSPVWLYFGWVLSSVQLYSMSTVTSVAVLDECCHQCDCIGWV